MILSGVNFDPRIFDELYEGKLVVFAFNLKHGSAPNLFGLSLTILSLWSKILDGIEKRDAPFICKINYMSLKLNYSKINLPVG